MKNKVAILGLGEHQLQAVKTLKKRFIVFGFDASNNPFSKKYVNKFYNIDFKQRRLIYQICKKNNIKKILSFNTEAAMNTVLWINDKFDKTKSYNKLIVLDKLKLRLHLQKNKFPTPNFLNLKKINPIKKKYFPAVVKPSVGSGSKGVFYAKNNKKLLNLFSINKEHYKEKKILIEKYIPGTEYAIDGWMTKEGVFKLGAISKKKRSKVPLLYDESLIINIESKKVTQVIKFIQSFSKSLKLINVPIHMEYKIFRKKLFLIDISLRGAGFSVYSEILSKIINQNTDQIIIDMLFNKSVNINKGNKKIFFLKFFNKKNYLKVIKNKIKLKKLKSFNKLIFYNLSDIKFNDNTRAGHILLCPNNLKILKKEIKKINFILK